VPLKIDSEFLGSIRRLRTFTHGCDLNALATSVSDPLELLERLVADNHLHKDEAGKFWSERIGLAYVDPFSVVITEQAVALLPAEIVTKTQVLPLYSIGGALTIAVARHGDMRLFTSLGKIAQMPISPVFSFAADIRDLIKLHYTTEEDLGTALQTAEKLDRFNASLDLAAGGLEIARIAESEEVVQFLNAIIYFALRRDASDIHIEPRETESHVRYRIDGNLRDVVIFTRKLHPSVVTRLKIMCSLDISETRLPADGRFSMPMGSGNVDFRFSSIPTQYGEKAVVRLLGSTNRKSLLSLDKMMVSRPILGPLRRIMKSPSGIIFVTGPTGSGKTTTLYAALAELNDPAVNISTIEDPIEMKLTGITQTQVHHKIDMSFAKMLRALLRQDPDIMLVGEIRDLETAKIATEAALTGHLVLATMHTNSAPEAITRLAEMGVDPYMIAPSVVAVLGQRLAARICEHCKESYQPAEEMLRRFFNDEKLPEVTFYRGRGCHVCNKTGYKGRVAFHELFLVNRSMRAKITAGSNQGELIEMASRIGYRPLRYDGLKKVLLGLTTIEEIEAQTPIEFED
jgi:type II secretory ATPase GspE/PulE/Tfp pilus assembly ATPase PilB-like protein